MHDTFTSKPVRSATDSYVRDYILAGAALLVGFLAVIYGEYWLAWGASLLFWLAFYDFTRRWPPEKEKNWWRLLVALVLIAATISLIRLKPAKEQRLAAVPQPQEVQTILVRYMPGMLPLSIAPKTTSYVLQLNPQISEGLYEQSNDSSAVTWWPRKPPSKKGRILQY